MAIRQGMILQVGRIKGLDVSPRLFASVSPVRDNNPPLGFSLWGDGWQATEHGDLSIKNADEHHHFGSIRGGVFRTNQALERGLEY